MRIRLGDDEQRPHTVFYKTKNLHKDPLATFVFKYRPLGAQASFLRCFKYITICYADILRASGIVPSNVGQKRRANADPALEKVKEEVNDDENADAAKIKALEVRSFPVWYTGKSHQ
jgi:hypothetical protein